MFSIFQFLASYNQVLRRQCCRNVLCFLMILYAFISLQACHSKQSLSNGSIDSSDRGSAKEILEIQEAFAAKNPEMVSQYGGLNIVVRMATKSELPPDRSKEAALCLARGLLGIVFFPAVAIVIPIETYFYFHEKKVWKAISGTMSNAELTLGIAMALQKKLRTRFTHTNAPKLKIETVIQSFGLVESGFQHCLIISAECIFSRDSVEIGRDLLRITKEYRSKDAPPPQCAHIERFAKDNAKLLKIHLNESIQVLAEMAIERLLKVEV